MLCYVNHPFHQSIVALFASGQEHRAQVRYILGHKQKNVYRGSSKVFSSWVLAEVRYTQDNRQRNIGIGTLLYTVYSSAMDGLSGKGEPATHCTVSSSNVHILRDKAIDRGVIYCEHFLSRIYAMEADCLTKEIMSANLLYIFIFFVVNTFVLRSQIQTYMCA